MRYHTRSLLLFLGTAALLLGQSPASVTPSSVTFQLQPGGALPPAQTITLALPDGASADYAVAVEYPDEFTNPWLAVDPLTGTAEPGAEIKVEVIAPLDMPIGTYTAMLVISIGGPRDRMSPSLTIPVTLFVQDGIILTATPASLSYVADDGGITAPQSVAVSGSGDPDAPARFTVSPTPAWLEITPGPGCADEVPISCSTPATLQFGIYQDGITALGLTPGNYYASVTLISETGSTAVIDVTLENYLVVGNPLRISVSPPEAGVVTVAHVQRHPAGVAVQLTATAGRDFRFTDWSGDVAAIDNPLIVVMDGPMTIIANFAPVTSNNGVMRPKL